MRSTESKPHKSDVKCGTIDSIYSNIYTGIFNQISYPIVSDQISYSILSEENLVAAQLLHLL